MNIKILKKIKVKFVDGYVKNSSYDSFIRGEINNPFIPSVCGIGYIGDKSYAKGKSENTRRYVTWHNMLKRCYDEKYKINNPTYRECTVCEEWHNFQNFAKWYDENYYEIEGEVMCLDKDILVKGNKIYSPETCIFVPKSINVLFAKDKKRDNGLPIGVCIYKKNPKLINKYIAYCNNGSKKTINLGGFSTPQKAFQSYKEYKEKLIKNIADKYKDKIPQMLFKAMYKYEVEITD